jgi:riboflavin synthase
MFTGIVQRVGAVTRLDRKAESLLISIALESSQSGESGQRFDQPVTLGESIAINGVCLTVTEFTPHESPRTELSFFVGFETLNRTNLRDVQLGSRVNLERALLASERLSGHIVQGHVDGEAQFLGAEKRGDANQPHWEARFEIPSELARYCVDKGSIALNGVSLTIAHLSSTQANTQVTIMLIPHTWEHTNFSKLKAGDSVNVEVDVLAKYMAQYFEKHLAQSLSTYVEKLCPPKNL